MMGCIKRRHVNSNTRKGPNAYPTHESDEILAQAKKGFAPPLHPAHLVAGLDEHSMRRPDRERLRRQVLHAGHRAAGCHALSHVRRHMRLHKSKHLVSTWSTYCILPNLCREHYQTQASANRHSQRLGT